MLGLICCSLMFFPFGYLAFLCCWRNWGKSCQDPTTARVTQEIPVQSDVCSDSYVTGWGWGEWGKVFEGGRPQPRAESQSITGSLSKWRTVGGGRKHVRPRGLRVTGGVRALAVCRRVVSGEGSWVTRGQILACWGVGILSWMWWEAARWLYTGKFHYSIHGLEMASLGWKEANSEPRAPVGKSQYELNEKLFSRKNAGRKERRNDWLFAGRINKSVCTWDKPCGCNAQGDGGPCSDRG